MSAWALAAAAASAIGNGINSSISNKQSLIANKKYFDYTLPKNQQAQLDMIRNSPLEQVRGYKNAGLNPASISSSYEGSGATGETGVQTTPITADPVGAYLNFRQMEMAEAQNRANVQKTNEETQNIKLQNEWFERVQQSKLDTEEISRMLMKNQSQEIKELLPGKVKEQSANIDLLNQNVSYRELEKSALEREYDFNGKKVKGSEIPFFKEIFALEMAQKTLDVDWFNAETSRLALDRDWKAVLTKEWFAPLIRSLTPKLIDMAPEVKKQIEEKVQELQGILDGISKASSVAQSVGSFLNDPYGSIKNGMKNAWNNSDVKKSIDEVHDYFRGVKDRFKRNLNKKSFDEVWQGSKRR